MYPPVDSSKMPDFNLPASSFRSGMNGGTASQREAPSSSRIMEQIKNFGETES